MSKQDKKIVIPSDDEVAEFSGENAEAGDIQPDNANGSSGESSATEPTPEGQSEAEVWREKFLRAKAELSNFQRRSEKDRSDSLRYANAGLIRSLLPMLDDLERVLASGREHEDSAKAILDGVELTLDNCRKTLREHGVQEIDAAGRPFDPEIHEAMMEQPSPDHEERTVLQELAKGYRLHDRVMRPAKVIVSKPIASESVGE